MELNEFLRQQKRRMDRVTFDLFKRSFVKLYPRFRRRLVEVGRKPGDLDRFIRFSRSEKTGVVKAKVLPVQTPIEETRKNVVAPWSELERFTEESAFRAVLPECPCRTGMKCSGYPIDLGCVFVGEGAKVLVGLGAAREAGVGEVMDHYRKGKELGLAVMMAHVGPAYRLLGMDDRDASRMIETCLCCPCCCVGYAMVKSRRLMPRDTWSKFEGLGFRATVDEGGCTGCGICAVACPADAIGVKTVAAVEEWCVGCGVCVESCPEKVVGLEGLGREAGELGRFFENRHM